MKDLTIHLDSHSKKPMYEQIYRHIREEIRSRGIPHGERLPSTRYLAKFLQVSRSTVEQAYDQLLAEGYIEAQPYRGFFVCEIEGLYQLNQKKKTAFTSEKSPPRYRYDFSPNGIDPVHFPYNVWRKLTKDCQEQDQGSLLMQGHPKGEYSFRQTIASYLHQARSVHCLPEQIIVGAGADYLFMLLGVIFQGKGRVAMEDPSYKQARQVLGRMGFETVSVGMDRYGMELSSLQHSQADIAYVMPSHQFPIGVVMPLRRRMELLQWASGKEERYIIEDDYDSEFRYRGKPIPALQGYDLNERVIYMGTFSKSIAPAIRVAYMVLPPGLLKRYQERAGIFSSTVSRTDQKVLEGFIEQGHYERHLNKMRGVYRNKHDILIREMKALPCVEEVIGAHAGVHILLRLKPGYEEKELQEKAEKAGIKVYGLSGYCVEVQNRRVSRGILLGYAGFGEKEITEAVKVLKAAWMDA